MKLGKIIRYREKKFYLWMEQYDPEKGITYHFVSDDQERIKFTEEQFRDYKKRGIISDK